MILYKSDSFIFGKEKYPRRRALSLRPAGIQDERAATEVASTILSTVLSGKIIALSLYFLTNQALFARLYSSFVIFKDYISGLVSCL